MKPLDTKKEEQSRSHLKRMNSNGYRKIIKDSMEMLIMFNANTRKEKLPRKELKRTAHYFANYIDTSSFRTNKSTSESVAKENAVPTKSMKY